jgi:hypothetical protein
MEKTKTNEYYRSRDPLIDGNWSLDRLRHLREESGVNAQHFFVMNATKLRIVDMRKCIINN